MSLVFEGLRDAHDEEQKVAGVKSYDLCDKAGWLWDDGGPLQGTAGAEQE